MSLSSIWRVLLRRWYVTVFGLVLTVALALGGAVLSPPTFEAHATVLLIPPKTNQQLNPYLNLGGMQEPSDAISRAMSNTETSDAVLAQGGSGKYSVARDTSTSGPIILITTDAKTNDIALKTNQLLIDLMGPTFDKLQADRNVPQGSYINVVTLSKDEKAVKQTKAELRAIIALAAVGLILTVLLVAYAEKTLTRRKKAKLGETVESDADPEPASTPTSTTRSEQRRSSGSGRRADQRENADRRREPQQSRDPEQRRNQRRNQNRQERAQRAAEAKRGRADEAPRNRNDESGPVEDHHDEGGLFDELSSVSEHDAGTRR